MSLMRARFSFASSSRASASRLRVLNFVMPAASSMIARRSVGLLLRICPMRPLLDDRVRLRTEPRAHKDVLDVAQPAEFPVQQVFALAGAEQAARDCDLSRLELALRTCGGESSRTTCAPDGSLLILALSTCSRDSISRVPPVFFVALPWPHFLGVALGVLRFGSANGRLVPIFFRQVAS